MSDIGYLRKNKAFLLGGTLFLIVCVLLLGKLSQRWNTKRFSSTQLFFSDGSVIYSYDFPHTKAVVAEHLSPEAEYAFYVKHFKGLSGFDNIVVSTNGRRLYYVYDAEYEIGAGCYTISELDLLTGTENEFMKLAPLRRIRNIAFSPDGKYVALLTDAKREKNLFQGPRKHVPELEKNTTYKFQIYIMEIETQEYSKIEDDCDASRPYWLPDSRSVLYGARDKIYKYGLPNGPAELVKTGSFPNLSPDGSMLAYFYDGRFCWGRLSSEKPENTFPYQRLLDMTWFEAGIEPMSVWSPDNRFLLLSVWGELHFAFEFPFVGPLPWNKFFILDVATGKIVYKDKIFAPINHAIIWANKS